MQWFKIRSDSTNDLFASCIYFGRWIGYAFVCMWWGGCWAAVLIYSSSSFIPSTQMEMTLWSYFPSINEKSKGTNVRYGSWDWSGLRDRDQNEVKIYCCRWCGVCAHELRWVSSSYDVILINITDTHNAYKYNEEEWEKERKEIKLQLIFLPSDT